MFSLDEQKGKPLPFGTKAETLEKLRGKLNTAEILPLFYFSVSEWQKNKDIILENIKKHSWSSAPLIVRSSSFQEDTLGGSNAGAFKSCLDIFLNYNFTQAVSEVIKSYKHPNPEDQVLIQPMLKNITTAGVIFTYDPNSGSPYVIVNYDDISGTADSITKGEDNDSKVFIYLKNHYAADSVLNTKIMMLIQELEGLFNEDCLDIEFATGEKGELYLLQVRPLLLSKKTCIKKHFSHVSRIKDKIDVIMKPHPYLYGKKTILSTMTDWNPAEMIGTKPKPLALSLYKDLITDSVWAYQRGNYGYHNLRGFPLIIDLCGLPYIDARLCFNSFIPGEIEGPLAEKLVNYYIDILDQNPSLHDKIEFDVVFSCFTFDIEKKIQILQKHNLRDSEIGSIIQSLKNLTNKIIHPGTGLWRKDLEKISGLLDRNQKILSSDLDEISKVYWLLEDCKRYGTLPFAGLARSAFIATQLLNSLVAINVIDDKDYHLFMGGLETISTKLVKDIILLSKNDFLKKYGHLRPGTYDITIPSYAEDPDLYFNWDTLPSLRTTISPFQLDEVKEKKIDKLLESKGMTFNARGLFKFIQESIESREYAKFLFTKNISNVFTLLKNIGGKFHYSSEDLSFLNVQDFYFLYSSSEDVQKVFEKSMQKGRESHSISKSITLPPVIRSSAETFGFHLPEFQPNFITHNVVTAQTVEIENSRELNGKIALICNADPGYDWIFTHNIKGLITEYGGINSHMAIRANELNIPAVIGVGEVLFKKCLNSKILSVDCANKKINFLNLYHF